MELVSSRLKETLWVQSPTPTPTPNAESSKGPCRWSLASVYEHTQWGIVAESRAREVCLHTVTDEGAPRGAPRFFFLLRGLGLNLKSKCICSSQVLCCMVLHLSKFVCSYFSRCGGLSCHNFDSTSLIICDVKQFFSLYILCHLNNFIGIDIQLLFRYSLYSLPINSSLPIWFTHSSPIL